MQFQPFSYDWCECLEGQQRSHSLGNCFSPTCSSFPLLFLFSPSLTVCLRLSPPGVSWTLSTLQHLIISWTCKCIHIHEGTDAKLTVAGTHRTVPTAQSASSTYGKKWKEGEGWWTLAVGCGGRTELNKEAKKKRKVVMKKRFQRLTNTKGENLKRTILYLQELVAIAWTRRTCPKWPEQVMRHQVPAAPSTIRRSDWPS